MTTRITLTATALTLFAIFSLLLGTARGEGYDDLSGDCLWRWLYMAKVAAPACAMAPPPDALSRIDAAEATLSAVIAATGEDGVRRVAEGRRSVNIFFDPASGPSPLCADRELMDRLNGLTAEAVTARFPGEVAAMTRRPQGPIRGGCFETE
jgi:hypothetical protein